MSTRQRVIRTTVALGAMSAIAAGAASCGGSGSGGGGAPPSPAVGLSDSAGAPNLAYRTRTVSGVITAADQDGMVVDHRTHVDYTATSAFQLLASAVRSDIGVGDCVIIQPVAGRREPSHRTVTASVVFLPPAATCRATSASPSPSGELGTATPFTHAASNGGLSDLLAIAGESVGTVRQVTGNWIVIAGRQGAAATRVITTGSTSYRSIESVGPAAVRTGQCAEVFAQLPSRALEAVSVTLAPGSHGACAMPLPAFTGPRR